MMMKTGKKLDMTLDELAEQSQPQRKRKSGNSKGGAPLGAKGAERDYEGSAWKAERRGRWEPKAQKEAASHGSHAGGYTAGYKTEVDRWNHFRDEWCRVATDADVNRVGGRIAHGLRNRPSYGVTAATADSIWTALKAMAIARSYLLEDGLDFHVDILPEEMWEDSWHYPRHDGDGVSFELYIDTDGWISASQDETEGQNIYVSTSSDPPKVAGAMANLVRNWKDFVISFMGPEAAKRTVESLKKAKFYLDSEGRDLQFSLEFGKTNEVRSLLYIYCFRTFKCAKVRSESDIHQLAGYIAAGVRESRPPVVSAISIPNVNQAVKAIALARNFIQKEHWDLAVRADFPEYYWNTETARVQLTLSAAGNGELDKFIECKDAMPCYVSSNSSPEKVAGAVANGVREGRQMFLAAMGPYCVFMAVKSMFLASQFLLSDQKRVRFAPEFADTEKGMSVICLHVLPESSTQYAEEPDSWRQHQ